MVKTSDHIFLGTLKAFMNLSSLFALLTLLEHRKV